MQVQYVTIVTMHDFMYESIDGRLDRHHLFFDSSKLEEFDGASGVGVAECLPC